MSFRKKTFAAFLVAVAGALAFPLLFGPSMGRALSHDEHQHLAAGVLVAREGLLPYRDFPFLHPPLLPLVYGGFLGHVPYLLLAARTFSTLCDCLIAGILFLVAFRAWPETGPRLALAALAPLLFVLSPVVLFSAGAASNHDLSILFALLATLCHLEAIRAPERRGPVFLSGLLLALAMGTRVTFAPLVLPFLAAILLSPGRRARLAIFAAGGVLGALPVLWLFAEAPARAFFGVLQFSQTNLDYREATGSPQNMTLLTKLRFLAKEILLPNFAALAAAAAPLAVFEWQRRRTRAPFPRELAFLLALLPFLLAGSLAPSPAFKQYFFALIPFLVLIGLTAVSRLALRPGSTWPILASGAVLLAGSAAVARDSFRDLDEFFTPQEWTTIKRHHEARELTAFRARKILTLAPTHVLEAGLEIDPAFVTGPFAWRVADFVSPSRRRSLGLVGPADLESYLAAHPVDAILVGHERRWDLPLIAYAQRHGYRRVRLGDEEEALWLRPKKPAREQKSRPAR